MSSCSEVNQKNILNISLSNSGHHAMVIQENFGATTPYVYKVYICENNNVDTNNCGQELLKIDKINKDSINLVWDGKRLIISIPSSTRIYHFTNFWYSNIDINKSFTVKLNMIDS